MCLLTAFLGYSCLSTESVSCTWMWCSIFLSQVAVFHQRCIVPVHLPVCSAVCVLVTLGIITVCLVHCCKKKRRDPATGLSRCSLCFLQCFDTGWQEGHPATTARKVNCRTSGGRNGGDAADPGSPGKRLLNRGRQVGSKTIMSLLT